MPDDFFFYKTDCLTLNLNLNKMLLRIFPALHRFQNSSQYNTDLVHRATILVTWNEIIHLFLMFFEFPCDFQLIFP